MRTSQKGINLIKQFEGCSLQAYKCPAGKWTIGYGHTKGVKQGQKITQAKAEELLKSDLINYEKGVTKAVKVPINQNQYDALVSFSYNVGLAALRTSTLLKKLNKKDYTGAANEFMRWNKANGKVLNGLTKRRAAEQKLFKTSCEKYHTVKKGETLTSIAKKYKTTISKLVKLNKLKNPNLIIPGQKLRIK